MAASDTPLGSTPIFLRSRGKLPDWPSRRRSLSHYLRKLKGGRWRGGSRPPTPPPSEELTSDNPWDDPALWMLMFH